MATATKIEIDEKAFFERLTRFYDHWKQHKQESSTWAGADAIVINNGESEDDVMYKKCASIHLWLFGYEFPETAMVFASSGLKILTSQRKVQVLKTHIINLKESPVPVEFIVRDLKDPTKELKHLLEAVQKSNDGKIYGTLTKEKAKGAFMDSWVKMLQDSKLTQVDVTSAISDILAIKDAKELKNVRTAATISSFVLGKNLLRDIETIIDEAKKVTHSELAEKIEKLFEDPSKISQKLQKDSIDSCYTPIIQSGGKYDLRPDAAVDDNELHFGTIICALGARYKFYCSNVARTYLVDPIPVQSEIYALLLEVENAVINSLKPDVKLSDIYNKAADIIKSKKPELMDKFTKNCGFGTGIEFRDSTYNITAKNDRSVKPGMVFNVMVGFHNIELPPEAKTKNFSALLSDTVLVGPSGPELLTDKAARALNDITYEIDSEGPTEEVKTEEAKPKAKILPNEVSLIVESKFRESTVARKEEKNKMKEAEDKRREHQKMLEEKKLEEAAARFSKNKKKEGSKDELKEVESYQNVSQFPKDLPRFKIFIDAQRESIFLPIYGYMVPFHISTIKNASKTDEEYLRINFVTPADSASATGKPDQANPNPRAVRIKEVTYRCSDPRELNNSLRLIKELKKRQTARETERRETANLIVQEKLVLSKGRNPRLSDVFVRPNPVGRRTVGNLEAHTNGFRFSPNKGENIDILYKNIKHAFLQPAEKELIVLVHFHLHHAIMVGKKKTNDVQFCTEVMEVSQALDGRGYDADELEDEQRERQMRAKLNNEFQSFVRKVEEFANVEFDIPYRDLGFYGVPNRSSVFLQPTVHCLVNLSETPFFVLTLDDVEIAYFERVQFSLRNFDLVFVFKDYDRPVVHVNTIEVVSLDTIKEWLDQCDIKYYEGTQSLNWGRIMATIKEDPNKFFKEGGWAILNPDSSDEEQGSGDEEPSEDEFNPSEDEYDEEGDEDEGEYSEASDEDEVDYEEESEDGEDWEELERKAEREDKMRAEKKRERGDSDVSDDEERAAAAKRAKKAPPPAKKASSGAPTKPVASKGAPSKPAPSKPGASKTGPPTRK